MRQSLPKVKLNYVRTTFIFSGAKIFIEHSKRWEHLDFLPPSKESILMVTLNDISLKLYNI